MILRQYMQKSLLIVLSLIHRKNVNECNCAAIVSYNPPTGPNITAVPYCDCSTSGFGIIRKMSYGCATTSACDTMHVDLSSACIKCGMCMAIADEINQTLLEAYDMLAPDDWLNDTEVVLLLRTICNKSFRKYNLREIDGKRFISDPLPGDKLVASSADGLWEKNLRDMCHNYLDEIQELQLYKNWEEWCKDNENTPTLEDILCRNEISSLRDCRGIGSIPKRDRYLQYTGEDILEYHYG